MLKKLITTKNNCYSFSRHTFYSYKKLANFGDTEKIIYDVLMYSMLPSREIIFGHMAKLYPYELYDLEVSATKKRSIA